MSATVIMATERVVAAAMRIAASDLVMVGGWADGWTAGRWIWRMGGWVVQEWYGSISMNSLCKSTFRVAWVATRLCAKPKIQRYPFMNG